MHQNNPELKQKYVILMPTFEFYYYALKELETKDNVLMIWPMPQNNVLWDICMFLWERFSFFRSWWTKKNIVRIRKNCNKRNFGDAFCFLLFGRFYLTWEQEGFLSQIKKCFPNARIVLYFGDLIGKSDIAKMLKNQECPVDRYYTYDECEAKKYNISYLPYPYAARNELNLPSPKEKSDICFLGQPKDRMQEIVEAYDMLTEKGYRCSFHVVLSRKEYLFTKKHPGIHYHFRFIPYYKYLQISNRSKCILEIIQHGSSCSAGRLCEAVSLGKRFITNNSRINENPLYDERYTFYLDDFYKLPRTILDGTVSYKNSERLSAGLFLKAIEKDLSNHS